MTLESTLEQKKAKLNECTEDELKEFKKLNSEYKIKFKFPFIIAVSNKNKNEILQSFRKRIKNEINQEFSEAINQVKEIASIRIEQIKKKIK